MHHAGASRVWLPRDPERRDPPHHRIRKMLGASIPSSAEATVQSAYEASCRHSENYKGDPEAALFEWPEGKGSGIWFLNLANANRHIRELSEE